MKNNFCTSFLSTRRMFFQVMSETLKMKLDFVNIDHS